ncbi:GNAT family N-acetyltransferase [Pseudomonadota bacterium]
MNDIEKISEKIERSALESLHSCCPQETIETLKLGLVDVADGLASLSGSDPSILINRSLGLGAEQPTTAASLERVINTYAEKSIQNYFIHLYEDELTNDARELLAGTQMIKKRGWMKFAMDTPQPRTAKTALRVEKITASAGNDFGTIVCDAFGMSQQSVPLLASIVNDDRWHIFVTYEGDNPAGAGAMFIEGKSAWLEWGATNPNYRRRGSQSAVMAARLSLAAKLGCQHVFTETGEAVEGDPQHSYKNILKAGFQESVLRQNWSVSPSHA